ncbi:MAG: hypothetical protein GYA45_09880 [Pelolinea sp.]|jgi:hypothetical protein|nr:hypothetical protein [Pelolinea sp.]
MENGLLWFDDRKDVSTEQKIQNAVLFYQQKYGTKPDRCTINSDTPCSKTDSALAGLRIEVRRYILPNHFLLEKDH